MTITYWTLKGFMSNESETNLTPYMLTGGPLLLLAAFFSWPAADYIGERGAASLADEAESLMPLMIMAVLGTTVMFSGLYLLNSQMMENAKGMNKQLLSVGGILIVTTLVGFMIGMGSNVNVINAEMTPIDTEVEEQTWASEEDQTTSQREFLRYRCHSLGSFSGNMGIGNDNYWICSIHNPTSGRGNGLVTTSMDAIGNCIPRFSNLE